MLAAVELLWRHDHRINGAPIAPLKPAVKAALSSGVASHTPHLSDNVEHAVAVTVKHFAANNTEYQRLKSNSRVSARAMREIYMKAFETVISESKPYSIMTSYNILNGTRVSENPLYCHDILRGDFGFDGMIMSDFANAADHVKELSADQDLKMHFGDSDGVVEAMKNGTLERARVRECVKRILTLVMLTTVKNEKK